MKSQYLLCAALGILILTGCSTSQPGLFGGSKSPHEKYKDGLSQAGLSQTQMGSSWISAAAMSLQQPQNISLPYKETGYFAAERPAAHAYIFSAKRGEQITAQLTTNPASGYQFFAELWQKDNNKLLASMDTVKRTVQLNIDKDGQYIIRIQPELLRTVEYTISITATGSLAFPVHRSGDPRMISFWGAGRDGGARSHEGIDISAKFRTPALAGADGYITRVGENNLGGKVVFLRPDNADYNLYYAHLDSQSVSSGQRVRAGDVVGLVGNTGNAQHTAPHLHFGIYTNGGAIDPLAFIDNRKTAPAAVKGSTDKLNEWVRLQPGTTLYAGASNRSAVISKAAAADVVQLIAATDSWYRIITPAGQEAYIGTGSINSKPLKQEKTTAETKLLDAPSYTAPAKYAIARGSVMEVIGNYNNFSLVRCNGMMGWVTKG